MILMLQASQTQKHHVVKVSPFRKHRSQRPPAGCLISSSITNVQEHVQVVIVDIAAPEQKSDGCLKDLLENGIAVGEGLAVDYIIFTESRVVVSTMSTVHIKSCFQTLYRKQTESLLIEIQTSYKIQDGWKGIPSDRPMETKKPKKYRTAYQHIELGQDVLNIQHFSNDINVWFVCLTLE